MLRKNALWMEVSNILQGYILPSRIYSRKISYTMDIYNIYNTYYNIFVHFHV